jgi:hypothetical protein
MSRRKYFFSQKPSRGHKRVERSRSLESVEVLLPRSGFSPSHPFFVVFYEKKSSQLAGLRFQSRYLMAAAAASW